MSSKETEFNKVKEMFEELKKFDEADAEAFLTSQKKFEAISAGMEINEEGKAETVLEQLMDVRSIAAQARGEQQKALIQLKYSEEQLKIKEKEFGANSADSGDYKREMVQLRREIDDLQVRRY